MKMRMPAGNGSAKCERFYGKNRGSVFFGVFLLNLLESGIHPLPYSTVTTRAFIGLLAVASTTQRILRILPVKPHTPIEQF